MTRSFFTPQLLWKSLAQSFAQCARVVFYVAAAAIATGCAPEIHSLNQFGKEISTGTFPISVSASPSPSISPIVDHLVFSVNPSDSTSGLPIGPSIVVEVLDPSNAVDTTSSEPVTLSIAANPSSGTLAGTVTVNAINGVATFPGLGINMAGAGYTLSATASSVGAATSTAFAISAGAASQLVFSAQPGSAMSGASLGSVAVAVEDAAGNVVTGSSASITLAIGNNAGPGGTLSGSLTASAVSGVATFPGLSIDVLGTAYTLAASGTSLTGATSAAFNISAAAASKLVFGTQPANAQSAASLGSITVKVEDSAGNVNTGSTASITLAIGNNAGPGGTLSGTKTVSAVAGVATFPGLSIDLVGTAYTLLASASSLTSATSSPFNITAGSASKLAFTAQPSSAQSGASLGSIAVLVEDAAGNPVTSSTASITLAIGTNAGPGGTLSGTKTVSAILGVAIFSGLSIDIDGTAYTLSASASSLTGATSTGFNITAAAASKLVFTTQPTSAAIGASLGSIAVTVEDAAGNVVTSSTASITIAIGNNAGPGGVLSGTATVSAVSGVATFPGLNINLPGTGYTLTAAASSLTGATSSAFNITGSTATQLAFTTEPVNTAGGATMANIVVKVEDSGGAVVTSSTAAITMAIDNNPGPGTLSDTVTVNAVAGVATFSTLSINKKANAYTLTATSGALTAAVSTSFNITLGAAAQLAFTTEPTAAAVGASISPSIKVTVEDLGGNKVTSSSASITLAIGTNPSAGVLSGTVTQAASSGVATFNDISINLVGTGYTLTAAASSLTGTTSTAFNITASSIFPTLVGGPLTIQAGVCTLMTVNLQDGGGTNYIAPSNTTVGFGNDENFDRYFSDSGCTTPIWSVVVPSGSHSTTFYYQENEPWEDNQGFTGSSPLAASTFFGVLTTAGPIQRTAIAGPSIITPGTCSSEFQVTALDMVYNMTTVDTSTLITLSTTGATIFYSDPGCNTILPANQIGIPNSGGTANFYTKTAITENVTLTASVSGNLSNGTFNLQANNAAHILLVSTTSQNVCYVIDGVPKCWGSNSFGQLGNGTTTDSNTPVAVSGLAGVTAIANSGQAFCAANSTGVFCWGNNNSAVFGNGTAFNTSDVPMQASVLDGNVTQLAGTNGMGGDASQFCAIDAGVVYCWGNFTSTPTEVVLSKPAVSVGVGGNPGHACAVLNDGTVWCWGSNANGQLGNGTTTDSSTPVQVSSISGATQVGVLYASTCAIASGDVYCWGNDYSSNTPVLQSLTGTATQISAGFDSIYVVKSDGSVWYSGFSDDVTGSPGNGNDASVAPPNFLESNITSGATSVAGDDVGACVVVDSAGGQPSLQCWAGDDTETVTTLGNGSTGLLFTPFWTFSLY